MAGALVRGGVGSEIALRDILPAHLRSGLSTRARTEPIARDYEKANPGAVVVCDWELFDDADIAAMDDDARELALDDRHALAERRAAAAALGPAKELKRGGDPDRNREMLRRAKNEIAMLDPRQSTAAYKKRFEELVDQIHQLEESVGLPKTEYKIGVEVKSTNLKLTDKQRAELLEKVGVYRSLPFANRKGSIENAKDPMLSQMLLDVETDAKLRDMWALKLVELAAAPAV